MEIITYAAAVISPRMTAAHGMANAAVVVARAASAGVDYSWIN